MGQVLQGSCGQAPARQACLNAGLPHSIPCTTVNKVCASGIKSIMLAAQGILSNSGDVYVAGGMESMSNSPYYLARGDTPYGGINLKDGILLDGLTDSFNNKHMGECAELIAKRYNLSREDQDKFAKRSYTLAAEAIKKGIFKKEITPVLVKGKRGKPDIIVSEDEEVGKVNFERMVKLDPVFDKTNGTITAANASSLSDGAAACVLTSSSIVTNKNLKPLAKVVAFADAATDPLDFPIAPALAVPKVISKKINERKVCTSVQKANHVEFT
jgi:acetyl-coA acetyltransferase, mitochondrial